MDSPRFRIRQTGKYGFIDESGYEVIEPIFDYANDFKEGLATIRQDGKYGFINASGDYVIEPRYKGAVWFENGLALVENESGQWGYINKDGNLKVPFQHFDMQPWLFNEGFACVQKNGKRGFIDTDGNMAISNQFDYARNFSGGLAVVKVGGQYHYIDHTGRMISPEYFEDAGDFNSGFAVVRKNGKAGIIDLTCEFFIENKYDDIISFHEGIAILFEGNQISYLNKGKKIIYEMKFHQEKMESRWLMFSEGLAPIYRDGQWGFINTFGDEAIKPFATDHVGSFGKGFASFSHDGHLHGFINFEGHIVIEPQFTGMTTGGFKTRLARVSDGFWGYINKSGNFVWKQTPETGAKKDQRTIFSHQQ